MKTGTTAAATTMTAVSEKMEASESSSLVAVAEAAGDEPWNPSTDGNGLATPSLIDLSTGVMGLDSLSPEEQHQQQQQSASGAAGSEFGPLFDPTTERNVTVLVGRTAHLHCRVRYLGNRTVGSFLFFYDIVLLLFWLGEGNFKR